MLQYFKATSDVKSIPKLVGHENTYFLHIFITLATIFLFNNVSIVHNYRAL
jgi:hypothetical protein